MAGGVLIGALLRVARYGRWKLAHRRRVSNNSVDADQAEPGPRPGRISMALSMALLSDDDPANGVPSTSSLIPKVAPTKRGHHPAPHAAQQPGVVVGATRSDSLLLALTSSAEENAALQARDPLGQALGRAQPRLRWVMSLRTPRVPGGRGPKQGSCHSRAGGKPSPACFPASGGEAGG